MVPKTNIQNKVYSKESSLSCCLSTIPSVSFQVTISEIPIFFLHCLFFNISKQEYTQIYMHIYRNAHIYTHDYMYTHTNLYTSVFVFIPLSQINGSTPNTLFSTWLFSLKSISQRSIETENVIEEIENGRGRKKKRRNCELLQMLCLSVLDYHL